MVQKDRWRRSACVTLPVLVVAAGACSSEPDDGQPAGAEKPLVCDDLSFEEASDDVASDIEVTGGTCDDAEDLVRQVAASHNFYSGPPAFEVSGFTCTVTTEDEALPVGRYRCASGDTHITWQKT